MITKTKLAREIAGLEPDRRDLVVRCIRVLTGRITAPREIAKLIADTRRIVEPSQAAAAVANIHRAVAHAKAKRAAAPIRRAA